MDSLSDKEVENVGNEIAKFMYELHNLDFNKDISNNFYTSNNLLQHTILGISCIWIHGL